MGAGSCAAAGGGIVSCPRCNSSNHRHVCALNVKLQEQQAYVEKERNERIEANRAAIRTVGDECTPADHLRCKQSEAAFLLGTRGWYQLDDDIEVLIVGACRRCGGSLALFVRSSDKRLELAREALK